MNHDLKDKLINQHVELFPLEYQYKTIDVGDGLFLVIEELLSDLQSYPITISSINDHKCRLEVTYQVTRNIDMPVAQNIRKIIDKAVKAAEQTCHLCGKESSSDKLKPNKVTLCSNALVCA